MNNPTNGQEVAKSSIASSLLPQGAAYAKSTPFTVSMIRYTRAEMEIPAEGDQTPGRISITVDGRSRDVSMVVHKGDVSSVAALALTPTQLVALRDMLNAVLATI